jgi:dTMP kinase
MAKTIRRQKGLFLTLEGGEGCGKSTQIRLLAQALVRKGYRVWRTRDPGGTPAGEAIRQVLLDHRQKHMSALCETLLYLASRSELVDKEIRGRLSRGEAVISDRWLDATVAYQGYGGGMDPVWIRRVGAAACRAVLPDRTVFLDLAVETGLARARRRSGADRMERKGLAFHRRVQNGFRRIARTDGMRFRRVVVRPEDAVERVHEKVMEALADVL